MKVRLMNELRPDVYRYSRDFSVLGGFVFGLAVGVRFISRNEPEYFE